MDAMENVVRLTDSWAAFAKAQQSMLQKKNKLHMGLSVIKEISLNKSKKKVSEKNVHALTATLQGIT